MIGQNKYISITNSIKMKLDGPSLACMTEDVVLTMKSAAFHNVLVRKYRFQTHSYNYNSAEVCLPGHRIPSQFKQRSTTYASLTIDVLNFSSSPFPKSVTNLKVSCNQFYENKFAARLFFISK
ncbi:hypothetical protein RYX36_004095 [Vicia faba]